MKTCSWRPVSLLGFAALLAPWLAHPAPIDFAGQLDFVDLDAGGAVYSGTNLGTAFTGTIDDVTFSGNVSDGTLLTNFTCCIAAGGMEFTDNEPVDAATAARLNSLLGSSGAFAPGHFIDLIDIEGDVATAGGGRLEAGISYVLDPAAFSGGSAADYPFDPADLYLALFFILEEDSQGEDIFDAMGRIDPVPLPATAWLLLTGFVASLATARRRHG